MDIRGFSFVHNDIWANTDYPTRISVVRRTMLQEHPWESTRISDNSIWISLVSQDILGIRISLRLSVRTKRELTYTLVQGMSLRIGLSWKITKFLFRVSSSIFTPKTGAKCKFVLHTVSCNYKIPISLLPSLSSRRILLLIKIVGRCFRICLISSDGLGKSLWV